MQSNKAPKKTRKVADKPVVAAGESAIELESAKKPRAARASSKNKSETEQTQPVVKHHHKLSTPAASEPSTLSAVPLTKAAAAGVSASVSVNDAPARIFHHNEIAELAHSYWVERGHRHGSAEEDWLRAEEELFGGR